MPSDRYSLLSAPLETPETASRVAFGGMHPSKIHNSTTKSIRSLSSHPVNDVSQSSPSESTIVIETQDTPSRVRASLPDHMNSPTFDFSFERPESDLSTEAQKIMQSVREEAAKIKAQMLEERAKQDQQDGKTEKFYSDQGTKVAKPNARTGRFSDVHKQQFKKMDSIASHASTWKHKLQGEVSQSLKRSCSKAGLDEATTPKSLIKSKSMRSLHFNTRGLAEVRSPDKRARRDVGHDVSFTRPVSRDTDDSKQSAPAMTRYTSKLPSATTTPTKASLARSASVKNMKSSMIPSLSRTASSMTLGGDKLVMPRTEGSNKYAASLSRFSGSMKSILYRAQPKSSEGTHNVVAGVYTPLPKAKFGLEKDLPSLPSSPSKCLPPMQPSPTGKRVNISESIAFGDPKSTGSVSMSKIPTPCTARITQYQAQHPLPSSPEANSDVPVTYPLLASSPNITTRRPIPKPTTPGDFTFRAHKEIQFSPAKVSSPSGTTIRVVRPSGFPTPMLRAFDVKPSIPHGMSNKKRKHAADDSEAIVDTDHQFRVDAESKENRKPEENGDDKEEEDEEGQRQAKKQRLLVPSPSPRQAKGNVQSPLKRRFGTGGGKTPKKGTMTLARLSALARPKERR